MANMEDVKKAEDKKEKVDSLKALLESDNLGFTSDSEWETLVDHISVHKYFMNQNMDDLVSWDDALASWMEKAYSPILKVIDWWEVKKAFSKSTKGQLLFAVSGHWYYMLEKDPTVGPEDAANHYAAYYGRGIGQWISRKKLEPVTYYV